MAKNIIQDFQNFQLHYNWGNYITYNIAPLFYPTRIIGFLNPVDSDATRIMIGVYDNPNAQLREFEVTTDVLTKKEKFINQFARNMVFVNMKYIYHLQNYLTDEIRSLQTSGASTTMLTRSLGWQEFNGTGDLKFILETASIGNQNIKYYDTSWRFQEGSLEKQLEFINREILPYPETQLAMTLGLSSIVAGYVEPHLSVRYFSNQCKW